ncbi:MAG: TonB-dependent receptor [Halioglobus sp.]|nr:TonB-dependent receptor [Halioglobus sp.]
MNKTSALLTLCTLTACALPARAAPLTQDPASDPAINHALEEVLVTSSGIPMPLRQVGTSVSVVTGEEIERLGYHSLFDVLRTQPGIGVSNQAGPGGVTSLRIRGEENYRTRFFIESIDVSDSSSPQTTARVEQMLSSGIERVEILRGPQGLMYGADAGGVINVSTAAPTQGFNGKASAELGRYDSEQFAGALNGGNEIVDFSVSAADFETDGFNARTTDTDLRDDDGYANTTLHGRLGVNVSEDLRVTLVARDVDSEHDYDGCRDAAFEEVNACTDEFSQTSWRASTEYATGRFTHELFYGDTATRRDFFTEGVFSFRLDGDVERTGYRGSFQASEQLTFVYGAEQITESIDDGFLDTDRDQQGYYAEYQGGFGNRLFLTAGLRYDDNEDFGSHSTYRLSAAYLIPVSGGEIKLRGTYGTGFRAPSLFEIATNQSPFTGSPAQGLALSEEQSEGYDLAVSWLGDAGLYAELIVFDQSISDEIFYDFDSFGYLQETGDTQSQGVELATHWQANEVLLLDANYTYTDSQDINGEQRPRRPEHMANLGISWQLLDERLTLGAQARMARDAIDVDGSALDDYTLLDLNVNFEVLDGLSLYARVENVADADYEEIPTYNTAGTAAYVGLRYAFAH